MKKVGNTDQHILHVDSRFPKDVDYLFVAQYIVQARQILDDANNFKYNKNIFNKNDRICRDIKTQKVCEQGRHG